MKVELSSLYHLVQVMRPLYPVPVPEKNRLFVGSSQFRCVAVALNIPRASDPSWRLRYAWGTPGGEF
jgi:hypothetical protein